MHVNHRPEISLARQSDCIEIAEMSRVLIEYGLRWRWKPSRILNLIRHPECVVIVSRAHRKMLGFAVMEFHEIHGHLNLLAVYPQQRRKGVAKDLLMWLELSARTAGFGRIELEVRRTNAGAIRFYEAFDYQIDRLDRGYYDNVEDSYHMTHELIERSLAAQRPK